SPPVCGRAWLAGGPGPGPGPRLTERLAVGQELLVQAQLPGERPVGGAPPGGPAGRRGGRPRLEHLDGHPHLGGRTVNVTRDMAHLLSGSGLLGPRRRRLTRPCSPERRPPSSGAGAILPPHPRDAHVAAREGPSRPS